MSTVKDQSKPATKSYFLAKIIEHSTVAKIEPEVLRAIHSEGGNIAGIFADAYNTKKWSGNAQQLFTFNAQEMKQHPSEAEIVLEDFIGYMCQQLECFLRDIKEDDDFTLGKD